MLTPQAEDGRARFFFVESAGVFAGNVFVRQDTFKLFGLAAERKFKVYFAGLVSDVSESVIKDVEVRNINATFELVGLSAEFNVEPQLPARIGDDAFPMSSVDVRLRNRRSSSLQAVLCQFQRVRLVRRFQVAQQPFATRLLSHIRAGRGD